MTDDLNTLRDHLKGTSPAPSPERKSDAIANAMRSFDDEFDMSRQGFAIPARPTSDRTIWARLVNGGVSMLNGLTSRTGLAATTGLVTAGVAVLLVLPKDALFGPTPHTQPPVIAETEPLARVKGTTHDAADLADSQANEPAAAPSARLADAPQDSPVPLAELAAPAPNGAARSGTAVGASAHHEAPAFARAASPKTREATMPRMERAPVPAETDNDRFANAEDSPVKTVADAPVSTFSVDVDTASWSIVRSSLMSGHLPPAAAVRTEEMVNYFPYAYPAPQSGDGMPFQPSVSVSQTPWNPDTQILHIALQGVLPEVEARPPLNLVFLIDTSGSMHGPDRLPLLAQSFRLMLGQLRPEDRVAIVTYAGSAGQVLAPTPASDKPTILAALERLEAGGSTAGQAGLDQAYGVATQMAVDTEGSLSRVILATDGDFNVGPSDPEALKADVARKRDSGVYLSVLGFGRGNLNDALMQALAQNGNGQAAFIDTLMEAQKVLVDQLTGALFPIAQDVKIQVEFNPARIAEYRLIGYETRALRREDFNNDAIDAGEIGAGHQVTALYEITPVGSPAVLSDPLRYDTSEPTPAVQKTDEVGFLRLRAKPPGGGASTLIELPIPATLSQARVETRFATAIAGFGQLLRNGAYLGDWGWSDAIIQAEAARGTDRFGYRAEAVRLMKLAASLDISQP